MEIYNKNRDQNKSMHDEIREQNAKLKDASFKEKLAYFKEYYLKTTIIAVIVAIFVGHLAYTMITAPKDTAFAAFFFNSTGDSSSTELIDGFVAHQNIDIKKHDAYIDATMNYAPESIGLIAIWQCKSQWQLSQPVSWMCLWETQPQSTISQKESVYMISQKFFQKTCLPSLKTKFTIQNLVRTKY